MEILENIGKGVTDYWRLVAEVSILSVGTSIKFHPQEASYGKGCGASTGHGREPHVPCIWTYENWDRADAQDPKMRASPECTFCANDS